MNNEIIITGSSGIIGSFLKKDLGKKFKVLGIDKIPSPFTDIVLDINNFDILENILKKERPNIIINTVAIKDLIECNLDTRRAWDTNVGISEFLADYAFRNNAFFVQVSSDVVFDGKKGNYSESDIPSPINWYGATKFAAELIIQEKIKNSAICRTAQVFGPLSEVNMKELAECKKTGVLTNQSLFPYFVIERLRLGKTVLAPKNISSPTPVSLLSFFIKKIIEHNITGILHTAGDRKISRYKLALEIAKEFDLPCSLIKEKNDATSYLRPVDVSLNTRKIRKLIKYSESDFGMINCIKKWFYEQKY